MLHDIPVADLTNTTTTTGGGVGAMPEPGFPYGSYKVCAQPTVSGAPTGTRDIRTATGYDTKQGTSNTPAAETATNLVNDTVVNNTQTGTPTIAANPIYPATPVAPTTTGSIIVRLNRTGACH